MAKETLLAGITACVERKMRTSCDCPSRSSFTVADSSLQHEAPTILRVLPHWGKAAVYVLCAGAEREEAFVVVGT